MADLYSTVSIAGYNTNPPSDDGSAVEANRVKWSTIKSKLNDPVKTRTDDIDAALIASFAKTFGAAGIVSTAISYQVLSTDQGGLVRATTSSITITTPDAADVGEPFAFAVLNNSSGNITIDGSGSQTIDGAATVTVPTGAGAILFTDGSNWYTLGKNFFQAGAGISFNTATAPFTVSAQIPGFLSGLTLSTAGSSSTMSVAAGAANDAANAALMILSSAISKTTATWAAGTGNGGLDSGVSGGAIATSTWYHFYIIENPSTGDVDIIFSTNATAPITLPSGYTLYRRIGSAKTNGSSQWTLFRQYGDEFIWDVPILDVNGISPTGSTTLHTLTVPTGINVLARINAALNASAYGSAVLLQSGTNSSSAPGTPAGNTSLTTQTNGTIHGQFSFITSTSAQIRQQGSGTSTLYIVTTGWVDARGK